MKAKILLPVVCLALFSACASAQGQAAKPAVQAVVYQGEEAEAPVEAAEPAVQEVLYHGREEKTPEEALAKALAYTGAEAPLCPNCAAELCAALTGSEELPVQSRSCLSMVHGTDEVYKFSLTYEWACPACGYTDPGYTTEGIKLAICHGW